MVWRVAALAWLKGGCAVRQVITVTSRYMVLNNSGEVLEYGQRGTRLVAQLQPGCRHPFHWHSTAAPFQLCVRPAGDWNWSGAFTVG